MKLEDRLKSLGAGLAVATAAVALFKSDSLTTFWNNHPWIRYTAAIILCLLFLAMLFLDWLVKLYREKIMRKRHLSDIVVSKKISVIDIHDDAGHKATYFQKAHFSNIKNGDYIVHLSADSSYPNAQISPDHLQLANCSVKFDKAHRNMYLYFADNIQGLNKSKSLYPVEKFFYCYTELIDCFTHRDGDSWEITTFNYTKEYELNIHFPPGRRIDKIDLYRKGDEKDIKVEAANPIVLDKDKRDSIYLLITGFDQLDKFVVKWTYRR